MDICLLLNHAKIAQQIFRKLCIKIFSYGIVYFCLKKKHDRMQQLLLKCCMKTIGVYFQQYQIQRGNTISFYFDPKITITNFKKLEIFVQM